MNAFISAMLPCQLKVQTYCRAVWTSNSRYESRQHLENPHASPGAAHKSLPVNRLASWKAASWPERRMNASVLFLDFDPHTTNPTTLALNNSGTPLDGYSFQTW